jgi:hypothetical protein
MARGALSGLAGGLLALASPSVATAEDVPPFGPPLGAKAHVVRSFAMKITGAVKKDVTGKKGDGKTALVGQCKPTTWANFGIHVGSAMDAEQAGIAVITKGKIATGATGTFKLDKVYVDWFSMAGGAISTARYGGPGVLTITTHDGSPGRRRMVGSIKGSGLEGLDDAKGKTIDVEASFDMDFSCGVL